jgi:hypothetical protein
VRAEWRVDDATVVVGAVGRLVRETGCAALLSTAIERTLKAYGRAPAER